MQISCVGIHSKPYRFHTVDLMQFDQYLNKAFVRSLKSSLLSKAKQSCQRPWEFLISHCPLENFLTIIAGRLRVSFVIFTTITSCLFSWIFVPPCSQISRLLRGFTFICIILSQAMENTASIAWLLSPGLKIAYSNDMLIPITPPLRFYLYLA